MHTRPAKALTLLLLALSACSSRGGSSGGALSTTTPSPRTTTAPGSTTLGGTSATYSATTTSTGTAAFILTRTYVPDSALVTNVDIPTGTQWMTQRTLPGLHFSRPIWLTGAGDGSGRLFICELKGCIWAVSSASASGTAPITTSCFLDISANVHYGTEEGLWSIAFDPNFATNGNVFVDYCTGSSYVAGQPDPVRVRLSRFTLLPGNPNALDPSSEVVLLEIPKHYYNHNGGTIAFGPDGFLYMGVGDGGCCGDPERNGQNLGSLKGKILRLDVGQVPYAIPSDNPFVGQSGVCPEIWCYGMRNPWRMSFDSVTGRLWAGDVGESSWEEVDVITKGTNYGWSEWEGSHIYDPSITAPDAVGPQIEFSHQDGRSCVIGGYVYNGKAIPTLQGRYLFADYGTGEIWAAAFNGSVVTGVLPVTNNVCPFITSFGQDDAGELYVLSYSSGNIYKVVPAPAVAPSFPQTLSATGLFADLPTQTMRAGMIPYGVVEPHWSDGATMTRSMLLPHLDQLTWAPTDGLGFPADAILVKNFYLERVQGDPTTNQIVETRLLINNGSDWNGYSYQWNAQGTDATLLDGSLNTGIAVVQSGQPVLQNYYFPARSECLQCHTAAAGYVLGAQSPQLNTNFDYALWGGPVLNQLSLLSSSGVFANPLSSAPTFLPRLVNQDDTTATLDERARSYLHANCSHCHRPDGGAPVNIDLRFDTPLADTGLVNVPPIEGDLGVTGANIITPGQPNMSILYLRIANMWSGLHMPPLATNYLDQDGIQLIYDWISNIP
jgi:uncharacterized repeat protein (TIGR03806 family)